MPFEKKDTPPKDPFANIEFSDEGDMPGGQLSINEIILRHIRKISDISCKEFTGGYWERKPMTTASGVMFTEKYNEDVREAYCNSVNFLLDVIYPLSDDTLRTYLDEHEDIDKEEEDIKKKLKQKRKTFKQINIMFERINFWNTVTVTNE